MINDSLNENAARTTDLLPIITHSTHTKQLTQRLFTTVCIFLLNLQSEDLSVQIIGLKPLCSCRPLKKQFAHTGSCKTLFALHQYSLRYDVSAILQT